MGAERGGADHDGKGSWAGRAAFGVVITSLMLMVVACGGEDDASPLDGPPKGVAVLPDLVPEPPIDLQTKHETSGKWSMRFSSTLVNVGEGDFILHGDRFRDDWEVEQQIAYSESGSDLRPTDAEMVWGGDGHDHWHVKRVATYRIEPVDDAGNPVDGGEGRTDTKIGFCFYDSHKKLESGPDKPQYEHDTCGDSEDDVDVSQGLSPGWGDVYDISLPGQSVDITDLPDGRYRIWAEADPQGWFQEARRDNNVTWADVDLTTRASDGLRLALIVDVGPSPVDHG